MANRRVAAPFVVAAVGSNGRPTERNATVLLENTLKEMRDDAPVVDKDSKSTVGGVEDAYGKDSATEDQFITPWTVFVARNMLNEFMSAVKQNYGEKVLIQFEDFANHMTSQPINTDLGIRTDKKHMQCFSLCTSSLH